MSDQPETHYPVAWAAGLFDGEGSISIWPRKNHFLVQMRVAMTDEPVVRRFHDIIGVGNVHAGGKRPGRAPAFCWRIANNRGALLVALQRLLPYLFRQREGAQLLLRGLEDNDLVAAFRYFELHNMRRLRLRPAAERAGARGG